MIDNSFDGMVNFLESSGFLYKIEVGKDWYVIQTHKSPIGPLFKIISSSITIFNLASPDNCCTVSYEGFDSILEVPLKGSVTGILFISRSSSAYSIRICGINDCQGTCHSDEEKPFFHVKINYLPNFLVI